MLKQLAIGVVLVSGVASSHAAQVVSDFENAALGLDGWTVVGDPATGTPVRRASGGNPGGYAEVTDSAAGQVIYWVAPGKFNGDLSGFFGGTLSYDMQQSPLTRLFLPGPRGDVSIAGSLLTLVYSLPALDEEYPQATFTTRTLQLDTATDWRIGTGSGAVATDAQIQSVLGSVTSLRIRGEYSLDVDVNGLDNVILSEVTPVPEPSTALLALGAAALLAGSRTRRRGARHGGQ